MIKEFKKPDLTAPRCRSEVNKVISIKFVKEFIDKYPQYKDFSVEDCKKILHNFHGKLWDHALNNRDGVELPEGLGFIFLGTCAPARKANIDFGTSINTQVKTRHKNFESDNYLAKIFYTNFPTKYKFKNREMWMFSATRDFKRGVKDVYRENWKTYIMVESGRNISKYMKATKKNNYFRHVKENYKVDSSYNEFDLN